LRCWQREAEEEGEKGTKSNSKQSGTRARVNEGVHDIQIEYVIDPRLDALSETKGDNSTRASRFVEIQAEPQN
jgi:hypothetical protein